jgi:hypothetical protein
MTRLTDNDKHFGPITYGRSDWNPLRLVLSSGGGEDDEHRNTLTAYAFGFVMQINLPNLLTPFRIKHIASWDAATIDRMGRNWYFESFPREYGFSLYEGFLQIFLGAQTHDSSTTQSWCTHLPWTQWRFVRKSHYGLEGNHFWTEPRSLNWEERERTLDSVPKAVFEIDDYDGKRIKAITHIQEMEWHFGEGWFKWLSVFRKPMIRRSLDINFSEEVGPDKGTWKGGLVGTGIDMFPGELHESAFRRYCEQDHMAKYKKYRITFIGGCDSQMTEKNK